VKRFTVHSDIFTQRSRFLAAARKPEWIAGDPSKPVDLSDEDPDVFQAYLNCIYVGPETLEEIPGAFECEVCNSIGGSPRLYVCNICKGISKEDIITEFLNFGKIEKVNMFYGRCHIYPTCESFAHAMIDFSTVEACEAAIKASDFLTLNGHQLRVNTSRLLSKEYDMREYELADSHYDALIKLYLLSDKLQDILTVNMAIDKIQQFTKVAGCYPGKSPVSTAYQSTVEGSPLRKLLRDIYFYDTTSDNRDHCNRYQESGFPNEFLHDILKEYMRVKTESDDVTNFFEVATNDHLLEKSERDVPNACRYHQHDDEHPFCVTSSEEEEPCKTCKAKRKA
jgi:hypothetical protein